MFTNTTSTPREILRYRFILIFIVVIIIIAIIYRKTECYKIHPRQIKIKALIVYIAVIIVGFSLLMKWQAKRIQEINDDAKLSDEEKVEQIRRLDNVWSLSHFLFYIGLGIIMPNNWPIILVFEVCWELFEDFLGYGLGKQQYIETDGKKIFDILCNSTGYLIGNSIANSTFKRLK